MEISDNKPKNVTRCQAISNIIESVAKEQEALAEIIKAGGGRLHKNDVMEKITQEQLFYTNKSAEKLVNAVTLLEMVLSYKLALFQECICDGCCDHRQTKE